MSAATVVVKRAFNGRSAVRYERNGRVEAFLGYVFRADTTWVAQTPDGDQTLWNTRAQAVEDLVLGAKL